MADHVIKLRDGVVRHNDINEKRSRLPSLSGKGDDDEKSSYKRVPKELDPDWHKYLVIIVFMVIMIGVISGMYVGHDSMLAAVYDGREVLNLEDGSFELSQRHRRIARRYKHREKMADVRQYFIDKGNEGSR